MDVDRVGQLWLAGWLDDRDMFLANRVDKHEKKLKLMQLFILSHSSLNMKLESDKLSQGDKDNTKKN